MVSELCLVGTRTTDPDATPFTAGHRGAVRQCHRGMATIPTDYQSIGGGAMLEPASSERGLLITRIKSISENGPIRCCIRYPGSQTRAVGPGGRIAADNIRRTGNLIDKRQQRCENNHEDGRYRKYP